MATASLAVNTLLDILSPIFFPSLLERKKQGKPPEKTRIFSPFRAPWDSWERREKRSKKQRLTCTRTKQGNPKEQGKKIWEFTFVGHTPSPKWAFLSTFWKPPLLRIPSDNPFFGCGFFAYTPARNLVAPCGWEFNRGRGRGWESRPLSRFCFALALKGFKTL